MDSAPFDTRRRRTADVPEGSGGRASSYEDTALSGMERSGAGAVALPAPPGGLRLDPAEAPSGPEAAREPLTGWSMA
ncbi:MAG TPA: hypothetical protein ENK18_19620 [Deltaproteobacteria bacterium]|nr:hypothetical protein [Deltaproteobacteria bacterium]